MINKYAYCNKCEDAVEFNIISEFVVEEYKGVKIRYPFPVGHCICCGAEVATDIDYNSRKSEAKIRAYKKQKGIIDVSEISEIMRKYDVGKESLAEIAGFGKVTIKRYFDGFIPSKEYSDILYKILDDEKFFISLVDKNKDKLKEVTYRKIIARYDRLNEIANSKINQIVNYIVTHLEEVTPLALEKLLAFSNGVNYAINGNQLIYEECQAWQHGHVYPIIYSKYKKYGYKPIDNGIYSTHGCVLSLLSDDEIKAIELVLKTFGLYSSKTLEKISHSQKPWKVKRIGYEEQERGNRTIDELDVKQFFIENKLNTEENIMYYISRCLGYYES